MAHAENEIEISRPASVVFKFIANGENNSKWRTGVKYISLASGTVGAVGSVYDQTMEGPGGRTVPGNYRITVADEGKELSFEVITGPARPKGSYYLETTPKGTKIRFVLDFQPTGLAKLLGPMITKTMQKEVAQLTHLKEVLED